MRKLVAQAFVTLDGVVQDPGGFGEIQRGGWALDRFDEGSRRQATDSLFVMYGSFTLMRTLLRHDLIDELPDTERYRHELLAHCYRMLGSVADAEDVVQETYLRAWRSYEVFEGRSSLRTWLCRIATNACLSALSHRGRRFLPSGLGGPADDPLTPLVAAEARRVEPVPDSILDPAMIVAARDSMRIALIATLQELPGRQRAVFILRDVLRWPTADVARVMGTTRQR